MISARDAGAAVADRLYQMREQTRHVVGRVPSPRYDRGALAPVLLLPGVYETWQFLRPVADRLNALGHPIHTLPALGYNRLTIAASAELAQRYLDERDLTRVAIVAHSKGGLIAKHMMVTDDRAGRIDTLVAINSPFGGSTLANWAPVRTLRAFSPRDKTVMTLAANLEANARITSIYSRLDPLIPEGSALAGATNIRLPIVGHFRPLSSPALFTEVEGAISARG
ncbi:alpha/beta hydrolase [Glaciihabitans sp. INWT7]|uniref:PGAP1-like alpha/beta domain-containing protein n=1 Tax=Glaciihabitans sp. INWT7 TaxID=2596912 RepID=UPI0016235226|nr:alpha/beta hydrolase [Glaciihabitans sp. INWT7]QNE47087.1 alpha/beta hydrolase [Glaciihabitans sp. INWT7]